MLRGRKHVQRLVERIILLAHDAPLVVDAQMVRGLAEATHVKELYWFLNLRLLFLFRSAETGFFVFNPGKTCSR